MAIYEPVYKGEAVFGGGIGKDSPYGKATGLYKPNIVGPGSGKAKAIYKGLQYGYNYFKKYPKMSGAITGIAGGTLISNYARNASKGSYGKALYSGQSRYSRKRSYRTKRHCCCCGDANNKRQFSKRRFYR